MRVVLIGTSLSAVAHFGALTYHPVPTLQNPRLYLERPLFATEIDRPPAEERDRWPHRPHMLNLPPTCTRIAS